MIIELLNNKIKKLKQSIFSDVFTIVGCIGEIFYHSLDKLTKRSPSNLFYSNILDDLK